MTQDDEKARARAAKAAYDGYMREYFDGCFKSLVDRIVAAPVLGDLQPLKYELDALKALEQAVLNDIDSGTTLQPTETSNE